MSLATGKVKVNELPVALAGDSVPLSSVFGFVRPPQLSLML